VQDEVVAIGPLLEAPNKLRCADVEIV